MKSKLLVTGGAGFIGSEFVRQFADKYKIIVVDTITYAGDLRRIADVSKKTTFYQLDIVNPFKLKAVVHKEKPEVIVHFAGETHVDRSIKDATPFVLSNIIGTKNVVDCVSQFGVKKFVHVSTDEVYGAHKTGRFKETDELNPRNPYSATKASAEHLVWAGVYTHKLPAVVVRPTNNYGPWQFPEKLIPVVILKALKEQGIPVYGRGKQKREWLHVSDCAQAIELVVRKGKIGEAYNIGTSSEYENIEVVRKVVDILGKKKKLIEFVEDRPGHDFRYGINSAKIQKLGWKPKVAFAKGLVETVGWYQSNIPWVQSII